MKFESYEQNLFGGKISFVEIDFQWKILINKLYQYYVGKYQI
jgi:hypothetical protein